MTAPSGTGNGGDLRTLAADLGKLERDVTREVTAVVKRGAVNIKEQMRKDLRTSKHFKRAATAVDFDLIDNDPEVDGVYADIGPVVGRGKTHAGGLAWIAYFGSPSGGGGSVRDPLEALDNEAPKFERHLSDIVNTAIDRTLT